jgi:predicted dehydrogenase
MNSTLAVHGLDAGKLSRRISALEAKNKLTTMPGFGTRPDLAFMGLHDLIDNGETQACAAFKL